MAILNFPDNPQSGDQYTGDNGTTYIFDGIKWLGTAGSGTSGTNSIVNNGNTVQIDSTGKLVLPLYSFPHTTGTTGQVLTWPGSGSTLVWANQSGSGGGGGSPGQAATITIGTVITGAAGSDVNITNVGTTTDAIFDFTIPRGDKGVKGDTGAKGDTGNDATVAVGTVTTGLAGTNVSIDNVGTTNAAVFNFTIPRGNQGVPGRNGTDGQNGLDGTNGTNGTNGIDGTDGTNGARGATGAQGISVTLQGTKATISDLPLTGNPGDAWIVTTGDSLTHLDGSLWFWNLTDGVWNDIGKIVGPQGDQGLPGNNGTNGRNGTNGTNGQNGLPGRDGQGFTYRGEWLDSVEYVPYDVVNYLGGSYVALLSNQDTAPNNATYWDIIAVRAQEDRLVNNGYNFTLGVDGTVNFDPASNGKGVLQTTADLEFVANGATYNFGANGELTTPGNIIADGAVFASGLSTTGQIVTPGQGVGTGIVTANGQGNLYFDTDNALYIIADNTYQTSFNADGTVTFGGGYIFPNTQGTSGQVLVVGDNPENLVWANATGGGSSFDQSLNTTDNVQFNSLQLINGQDLYGSGHTNQISFGFAGTTTLNHYLRTRHNEALAGNAFDFYTSDGTPESTTPVLGLTIENGSIKSTQVLAGQGIPTVGQTATAGFAFNEDSRDTGMFSPDNGHLHLYSNARKIFDGTDNDVSIITSNNDYSGTNSWHFDRNGILTFPTTVAGPVGQTTQAFGMGNLFAWEDGNNWVISVADPATGAWGGNPISISPGLEGYSYLFMPNDATSNGNAVSLSNTASTGTVRIDASNSSWTFVGDGTLALPMSGAIKNKRLVDVTIQSGIYQPNGVYYNDLGMPELSSLWKPGLPVVLQLTDPTGDWATLNGQVLYISHVGGELVTLCSDPQLTTLINVVNGTYTGGKILSTNYDNSYISIQTSVSNPWVFGSDSNLSLPGDLDVGAGSYPNQGHIYIDNALNGSTSIRWLNRSTENNHLFRVYADGKDTLANERFKAAIVDDAFLITTTSAITGIGSSLGSDHTWSFGTDAGLTFPDFTTQYTAYQGVAVVSATAPAEAKGRLWFNTQDARMYVLYNNQWVDTNPAVIPPTSTYTGELVIEETRISNTDYTGAMDIEIENANKVWKFTGQGNVVFPDATVQTTAFPGVSELVIDGGEAHTWLTA